MLIVAVVDALAESRVALSSAINRTFSQADADLHLLPRMSVVPLALQELKFHERPNVVIVGPGLIEREIATVSTIRAQLPDVRILALIPTERNRIGAVEHLIRLGADDVVDAQASGKELLTRLVLLARRVERKQGGKLLLVEGVKGGVGATSVTAGIAELLAKQSKRVVVVDGDFANRGLSRFLRARPLINENLQLILDGLRACTPEFVAQSQSRVAVSEFEIGCVAPILDDCGLVTSDGARLRHFMSAIEMLDEAADYVLVDVAKVSGALRGALLRAADGVLLVSSQDPACLPGIIERVKAARELLSPEIPIVVVRNERDRDGISHAVWQRELSRVLDFKNVTVSGVAIPYSASASRWPVSGQTMVSVGTAKTELAFADIVARLLGSTFAEDRSSLAMLKSRIDRIVRSIFEPFISAVERVPRPLELESSKTRPELPHSAYAVAPQLEFFVSAPDFTSAESRPSAGFVIQKDEELGKPAMMKAA